MLAQHRALDVVSRFLDNACPDHHVRGGMDHRRAQYAAMRMLERDPGIAHASFYAAVVCGDLDAVTRALDADPSLAVRASGGADPARAGGGGENDLLKRDWGPKGWEPLLYLCFTRLPLPAVNHNSVAIAKLLLDKGANPNAYFMAGNSRYTPLVGVIGEGEEGRLRGRYVKQLNQREEELAEIERTIAQLEAEIEQIEAQVKQMIVNLG